MRKFYATFSGKNYHDMTSKIVNDAPKFGADQVLVYDDLWVKECRPDLMERHKDLLNHPRMRGFGWFFWKAPYMLDALARMNDGDVLLAADGDTYPISDLNPLCDQCVKDGGILLFAAVGCLHRHWGKRDAMHLMGMDSDAYRDRHHACARFLIFQKGATINFKPTTFYPSGGTITPTDFLKQWHDYTSDIRINTFDPSTILPEYPDLHQPRCEQAVLTNLAIRYNLRLYREACEYGNPCMDWDYVNADDPWPPAGHRIGDEPLYPQTFVQCGSQSRDPHSNSQGSSFRNVFDAMQEAR